MTSLKQTDKQPDSNSPVNPPLLAQIMDETELLDLPILTEVVAKADPYLPRVLNAEEREVLLHQLEKHIETLFTQKLRLHLEQLQRLAIDQAIDELKADLPELLRDALDAHLNSR